MHLDVDLGGVPTADLDMGKQPLLVEEDAIVMISAIIALGRAAGQQVISGRMSPDEAGAAYRDSVLRLVLRQPFMEDG